MRAFLNFIEKTGNKLPEPNLIFILGIVVVYVSSHLAVMTGWQVAEILPSTEINERGAAVISGWETTGETFQARSLFSADGLYWHLTHLVDNFINFPPLGIVLVAMLGIGIADRSGLLPALIRGFVRVIPANLLTPGMIFLGIFSSLTLDAGYVLLVPLAGIVYKSCGRSPIAGIAAVFAGVSAGFNANIILTSLDPLLAAFTETAARSIDPDYRVNPAANLYFMIASTVVITLTGWAVNNWIVEPRLGRAGLDETNTAQPESNPGIERDLQPAERKALIAGMVGFLAFAVIALLMVLVPGAPLHGPGAGPFDRWVEAIVPLIFFGALIPGLAYGWSMGNLRNGNDFAKMLTETITIMVPMIVMAFFAAQFIEAFRYSGLDRMLAMTGGQWLAQANLPAGLLILAFIALVGVFNLFIGSMSAKYALMAPVFVPMLMVVGISPELTQVAYRIGDSVTNIITPLLPYLVIILVFMRQYVPKAGIGTLLSAMLPYSIAFSVVWSLQLLLWMWFGWPLGPDGPLIYQPTTP
ncbi:MAG: AbgT family transporter [Verrucomicrobia bacterium]|nr:AbgT family transporter [Verrucomicrobiota bacterium]